MKFLMAGGGTGGHVIPSLAVARELKRRGHEPFFVGTAAGLEAKLVPAAGFPIEFIEIGGLKRVGAARTVRTLLQLPLSTAQIAAALGRWRPAAVFSMGGYAAGPVMLAACARRVPMVLMEPNAVPGFTNRHMGSFVARALVNFEETARYFPPGKAEVTGVPVRPEFFALAPKPRGAQLSVLITGGSRGSRTLNNAARESWPLFREAQFPVRLVLQTGREGHAEIAREFAASGLEGEVVAFIEDMPGAFAAADLVICRSGAGAVAEIAAAGKPAVFVPFPFAADDHQTRNAEVLSGAGAARLVADREFTGRRLFEEVSGLASNPDVLEKMGRAARGFARTGAAERAADILEQMGTS
jgi:UDP-N-acetylglucosamine--N-acetylmuramyl-(pentapeptide) pyrophosphoryl-undecaprenol N-acetylglucosamine transferase